MKKNVAVLACLFVGIMAFAQEGSPKGERERPPSPTEMLQRITKDLNLSEVQQKQFKVFLDAQENKTRPTEAERETRGIKDRKEMDAKLKSILTEAQYKTWQEIKEKRKPMGDKKDKKPRVY